MIKLTKDDILTLYKIMVDNTGGTIGIRDESLLDSALNAPFQTFGNEELYPSIKEKASRLCYGLIKNHPFIVIWTFEIMRKNGKNVSQGE